MKLSVRPPVAASENAALVHALARAGVRVDGTPIAYTSIWLRTATEEAVGNGALPCRYARSPRSTRGATRA